MDKILIVDDSSFFVDGLKLSLSGLFEDATVRCASNVIQAMAILQADTGFDLIVADPDLEGVRDSDLAAVLSEFASHAPVVVMAELASPEQVHLMLESGVVAYLLKRTAKQHLSSCLQEIARDKPYLPDSVSESLYRYRNSELPEYEVIDAKLSDRQKEVLVLLANGYSNSAISASLGITESTVKSHVSKLMNTFDVDNRTSCAAEAKQMGIL